ncbi:MAG: hypothetical protein ACJ71T_08800 [Actinomycetales bacterium]
MRSTLLPLAAALLLGTTACGGSNGTGNVPTPSASTSSTATRGATTTSKPASGNAATAVSNVKGRKHDAGVIVSSKRAGGLTVLVLNRYTVKGMSDAKLASDGAPISPHSDTRFSDQNKGKTYQVPVNPTAVFVINTCDDSGSTPTMTSTPTTMAQFLSSGGRAKTVVLLTYDDSGRLVRLDTDPAC